jgi:hypothetical protein
MRIGSVSVPKEWVLDAIIIPGSSTSSSDSYHRLSKVIKEENLVSLVLSSDKGEVASARFDIKSSATHIKFYTLSGGRYSGSMIVDPSYNVALGALPNGETRINAGGAIFTAGVVHPIPYPSVSSIVAAEGGDALVGEAYLVGGEGVTLSRPDPEDNTIRVDIVGDPNYARHDCEPEQTAYTQDELKAIVPCVLSNNGTVEVGPVVEADDQGNFTIMPSNYNTGDAEDMYSGDKPSLRIYSKGGQLYFEIAGMAKRLQ